MHENPQSSYGISMLCDKCGSVKEILNTFENVSNKTIYAYNIKLKLLIQNYIKLMQIQFKTVKLYKINIYTKCEFA